MKRNSVRNSLLTRTCFQTMLPRLRALAPRCAFAVICAVTALGLVAVPAARAAVTTTGSISPGTNPSSWTESTGVYVGYTGDGTVNVRNGSSLSTYATYIGYAAGATGNVAVDGVNSRWTSDGNGSITRVGGSLYVGYQGTGSLSIINGGTYTSNRDSYVGWADYVGSGTVTVDGAGSTWINTKTHSIYLASGLGSSAVLKITNGGKVTEAGGSIAYTNLDGNHTDEEILNSGTKASVIIDGVGSAWITAAPNQWNPPLPVYVGDYGTGTMTITNGGTFNGRMTIGTQQYAVGIVTVDGVGSTLIDNGNDYQRFDIGYNGHGTLFVTNGANASSTGGIRIGVFNNPSSLGTAVVNGAGSSLGSAFGICVGDYSEAVSYGTGRLSVTDGGLVTSSGLTVNGNRGTVLTVDAGRGSSILVNNGTGTVNNYGIIRLVAGTGAAVGTHTPIVAGTWNNNGTIQALGGKWNAANHTVTVSAATTASGAGGGSATIGDLTTIQRALITDSLSGKSVGAGFQSTAGSLTFTASAMSETELASLQAVVDAGQAILSGWDLSTTGYAVDDANPVYLSLYAGSGQSLYDLSIWHFVSGTWSRLDAYDLAYDGLHASFTATSLSGYAVTGAAPVPIPAAVWLLGPGLAGLVGIRRRPFGRMSRS